MNQRHTNPPVDPASADQNHVEPSAHLIPSVTPAHSFQTADGSFSARRALSHWTNALTATFDSVSSPLTENPLVAVQIHLRAMLLSFVNQATPSGPSLEDSLVCLRETCGLPRISAGSGKSILATEETSTLIQLKDPEHCLAYAIDLASDVLEALSNGESDIQRQKLTIILRACLPDAWRSHSGQLDLNTVNDTVLAQEILTHLGSLLALGARDSKFICDRISGQSDELILRAALTGGARLFALVVIPENAQTKNSAQAINKRLSIVKAISKNILERIRTKDEASEEHSLLRAMVLAMSYFDSQALQEFVKIFDKSVEQQKDIGCRTVCYALLCFESMHLPKDSSIDLDPVAVALDKLRRHQDEVIQAFALAIAINILPNHRLTQDARNRLESTPEIPSLVKLVLDCANGLSLKLSDDTRDIFLLGGQRLQIDRLRNQAGWLPYLLSNAQLADTN